MLIDQYLESLKGKIDTEFIKSRIEEQNKLWSKGIGLEFKSALEKYSYLSADLISINNGEVTFEGPNFDSVDQAIQSFGHWRKGPFNILKVQVDSEWRSDLKWNRLKEHLPSLEGKDILDVGCNNGYFMYRMLDYNPKTVFGIDPTIQYKAQFEFLNNLKPSDNLLMEMIGIDDIKAFQNSFDIIFSMGILYHHRSPLQQLFDMRMSLAKDGILILETIILPGDKEEIITPNDKYAGMSNVWLLPTRKALLNWLDRSKFIDIEIISHGWDTTSEQRVTSWSAPKSYNDFISGDNTIEGYPAPERIIIKAKKK